MTDWILFWMQHFDRPRCSRLADGICIDDFAAGVSNGRADNSAYEEERKMEKEQNQTVKEFPTTPELIKALEQRIEMPKGLSEFGAVFYVEEGLRKLNLIEEYARQLMVVVIGEDLWKVTALEVILKIKSATPKQCFIAALKTVEEAERNPKFFTT